MKRQHGEHFFSQLKESQPRCGRNSHLLFLLRSKIEEFLLTRDDGDGSLMSCQALMSSEPPSVDDDAKSLLELKQSNTPSSLTLTSFRGYFIDKLKSI